MTRSAALSRTSGRSERSLTESAARRLAVGTFLIGALCAPPSARSETAEPHSSQAATAEAQFRGCETAGWCRFWIESAGQPAQPLHRVRPDGVVEAHGDEVLAIAIRDRLNALLASMIHQHKRIRLHGMRELADGTFAAAVTVNGSDVASDPVLSKLRGNAGSAIRQ